MEVFKNAGDIDLGVIEPPLNQEELRRAEVLKTDLADLVENAEARLTPLLKDIDSVWIISGPEGNIDGPPKDKTSYNQTSIRLSTGVDIARRAMEANGGHAPYIYFNGMYETKGQLQGANGQKASDQYQPKHNLYLRQMLDNGEFERRFEYPANKVVITRSRQIKHSGNQLDDMPPEFIDLGPLVVVSDAYHLLRLRHNTRADFHGWQKKFGKGEVVLYPAHPVVLPREITLREIQKITRDYYGKLTDQF